MRRIVLLFVFPLLVAPTLAQDDMEGCGCGEEEVYDLSPPEGSNGEKVEDKVGNFSLVLPPGWTVSHEPQDQPEVQRRVIAARDTQSRTEIMTLEVWRVTETRAETFTIETPSDYLEKVCHGGFFERFYGQGSARVVRPDVDDSQELGGAEKSAGFEFRSITLQEQEKIDKAEKLRNRGDKTVEIPEYKPIVVRGRMALLSPHAYLMVFSFDREIADNADVMAEAKKIFESWKFYEEGEKPPPLMGLQPTTEDPANAKARKQTKIHIERARKAHKLELKFTLPPGFQRLEKLEGGNRPLLIVAQDTANNWVQIEVWSASFKRAGEENKVLQDKRDKFEEWASNWESKARGVKVPRKPQKFSMGKVRGTGYKMLVGNVEKFRGTFQAVLSDKSSWRTMITIETRGSGDTRFAGEIKAFLKSLKVKPLKK